MKTGATPNIGDTVAGKYRIERLRARGGMGAVFEATHELLGQRVALKVMLADLASSPQAVARFLNEARAASRIEGEHVARVLDLGQLEDGSPFIALELLNGSDLQDVLLSRGRLPVAEAVDYVLQALEALAQAHALGIVHRDLKPANLFVAETRTGAPVVKVLDFGISKFVRPLEGLSQNELATTASLLGSPAYVSPERLRGTKKLDGRADIWALGVILFELLSGQLPFDAQTVADMFVAVLKQKPKPLRTLLPDAPPEIEEVILRCLSKDPAERVRNVGELAAALAPFGSPTAVDSVMRVKAALAARPPSSTRPMGLPSLRALLTGSTESSAQWTTSSGPTDSRSSRKRAVVLAAVILGASAAGVGAVATLRTVDHAHAAMPASPPVAAAASTASAAEPGASIAAQAQTSPSSVGLSSSTTASTGPPSPSNAPHRSPAAPPRHAAPAAPTCHIDTWYDSDGQPHFKKVCGAGP